MVYCDRCDRSFSYNGFLQHRRTSQNHHYCDDHNVDFDSWLGLKEHYVQSPHHHYCQRCDEHFNTRRGVLSHYERSHHFCRTHLQIFNNAKGLKEHYVQHSDHYYCQYCDEHFDDEDDFLDHAEDDHFVCRPCGKIFGTRAKQQEHYENHHYYCKSCDRLFNSQSNLDHHLASSIHKPRAFACPGRNCNKAFVSISALILHAESGTCPSGTTRKTVNEYVVRMDRTNVITNPNRLITSGGVSAPPAQTRTYATAQAWNGRAYECFLCHKEFRALSALNAHLASPVHQSKIYRCPNVGACGMEFVALSGLSQHVEGGSCGVQRFRQVRDMMAQIQSGMRAIAL
ncbi:hypothetical protein SCHPADRAFT_901374 [Schizopora paradoxa]|uniref:C2H2-type domain-containing protein n=1 Tax=Schizopora paradoxa TaxID=27342 RepID=A0A0H2SHN6_9AGAM|nr:hypothetical protein SCHPADRAFT_901374 [Schizopora paradoxa]